MVQKFNLKPRKFTSDRLKLTMTRILLVTPSNPVDSESPSSTRADSKAQSPGLAVASKEPVMRGWRNEHPFFVPMKSGRLLGGKKLKEFVYWDELTWEQAFNWRKGFLAQFLVETRKCFPHVRRLLALIYRTSPWRMVIMIALYLIKGLEPASNLQTRGGFIHMVSIELYLFDV